MVVLTLEKIEGDITRMDVKTDIEIAQENEMYPITEIAERLGIDEEYVDLYGHYKAKIDYHVLEKLQDREDGKLMGLKIYPHQP